MEEEEHANPFAVQPQLWTQPGRVSTRKISVKRHGVPNTRTPRPRGASLKAIKTQQPGHMPRRRIGHHAERYSATGTHTSRPKVTPLKAIGPGRRGRTPRHRTGIHGEARSEAHMRTPRPKGTPLGTNTPDGPGPTCRRQAERGNDRAKQRSAHTRPPERQGCTLDRRPGPASIIEATRVPPAPTARNLPLPPPSHRQGIKGRHTSCPQ